MKVLIIRFSSIGDIVLTSPVLRCLKEQLDQVEIHYLTKSTFKDLVLFNPHVHKVHLLEESMNQTIRELRKEAFDVVIDLHNNMRSTRVKRGIGVKAYTVKKDNLSKWQMVNLKWLYRTSVSHIVERYLHTISDLRVKPDNKGLEIHIPDGSRVPMTSLPESHRNGFVAVAIGAIQATKRLPERRLSELCKMITGPIVLIGGPADKQSASRIQSEVGGMVHDCTGIYSILESASLMDSASSVVCHDSGAMHIACALGKRTISVWGNTVPEFGFGPYQPEKKENAVIFESKGLSCRPCSKLGLDRCPKGHFHCMENHDLEEVARAATLNST